MSAATEPGPTRLLKARVDALMSAAPVTITPSASLRTAAALMQRHRITCLPVIDQGRLLGLLSESMLVQAVILDAGDSQTPVDRLMQPQPLCVRPDQPVVDVVAIMTRNGVAHVPVTHKGQLVGIVTQTDLVRRQATSSVFMVIDIARADSAPMMVPVIRQVPALLVDLVDAGASAQEIGRVSTTLAGAVTRRLIELADRAIGPAPVRFAWLACGSQGRQEQTTISDQDNCLVLADDYDAELHGDWLDEFTRFVCSGLDTTGYGFCKGGMMATNPALRHTVSGWTRTFAQMVAHPDERSRLLASFIADARAVAGDETLASALRLQFLDTLGARRFFVTRMVEDALGRGPALTLFGRLHTGGDRSAPDRVDLKGGGVAPVADLARVHALAVAADVTSTPERLSCHADNRGIDPSQARELMAAYEVISMMRLRHQAEQTRQGQPSDNLLLPAHLPPLARGHLREALRVVRDVQKSLGHRLSLSSF